MKVLHVLESDDVYGAELLVLGLASELSGSGISSTVLQISRHTPTGPTALADEANARKIAYDFRRFSTLSLFSFGRRLFEYAREHGFNVVHCHGYKANILVSLAAKSRGSISIITTLHGWTSISMMDPVYWYKKLEFHLLIRFQYIVAVSDALARDHEMGQKFGSRLMVIRNGASSISCRNARPGKSELNISKIVRNFVSSTISFAYIGRISEEKGVNFLLEAISLATRQNTNLSFVIVGAGPMEEELKELAKRLKIESNVLWTGYCRDASSLIPECDVVVIPSLTEGTPLVALEALRASRPIIASAVGGLPEIIEDQKSGILVPPGRPDILAESIVYLANERNVRTSLGQYGRAQFESRFTLKETASRYAEIYRSLDSNADF